MDSDPQTVFKWPPLESDPEIFTDYTQKLGLPANFGFYEVYSLDEEMLQTVDLPVEAVVVCFSSKNCTPLERDQSKYVDANSVPYYMKQTHALDMACGVIASIHGIANNLDKIELPEDSILWKFLSEAKEKSPEEIAKLLENHNDFKNAHQVYAMQGQSNLCQTAEDVNNHYICFIYDNGRLIELDGCLKGPYVVQEGIQRKDLLTATGEVVRKRLENKNYNENFAMMYLASLN